MGDEPRPRRGLRRYGGVLLRVGCFRWVDAGNMAPHREAQRERMESLKF